MGKFCLLVICTLGGVFCCFTFAGAFIEPHRIALVAGIIVGALGGFAMYRMLLSLGQDLGDWW